MEKRKIKFNGMDLFIIITLVVIIFAGVYLLMGRGGTGKMGCSKDVEVIGTLEILGREKEFADIIKEGDIVAIGEKEKVMAEIQNVEILPSKTMGYDILNGRAILSEVPEKYDIIVTYVAEGSETESAIEIDKTPIRIGQYLVLSSKNWAGEGYVIGLETSPITNRKENSL